MKLGNGLLTRFFWFLFLALSHAVAAPVLVSREMFQGMGVLDASSPGALGTWTTGAWHKRPGGPRTADMPSPGWSADARGAAVDSFWDLNGAYSAASPSGGVGCWIRFQRFGTGISSAPATFLQVLDATEAPEYTFGVTANGSLFIHDSGAGDIATGHSLTLYRWYWFQMEWVPAAPGQSTIRVSYKPLGGVLTTLREGRNAKVERVRVRNRIFRDQFGLTSWTGRLGGASLYRIDALGDLSGPDASLLDPVEERHVWFVDPANGDDASDGLSPASAWKSLARINAESRDGGFFGSAEVAAGDVLVIDTTAAPLDLGATSLIVRTPGLTIQPAVGQTYIRLQAEKDISAPATTWTLYDPVQFPNLWMTTDGGSPDLANVVIWENDRWLYHPLGPTIEAVRGALQQTPGSFYSDGQTLYLHPFDGTDPNTDGKTYTRSRYRADSSTPAPGPGQSAVFVLIGPASENVEIHGLRVRKTALARNSDNDPILAYGIQIGGNAVGGSVHLRGCYVDYNSKHGIGTTIDGSNLQVLLTECRAEQCQPSGTVYVDFNGTVGRSGNRVTYDRCLSLTPAPVVGSTAGASRGTAYVSHNSGGSGQFAEIRFIGGNYGGAFSIGNSVDTVSFSEGAVVGGNPGSSGLGCRSLTATQCVLTGLPFSAGRADGSVTVRNCLLKFSRGQFVNNASALAQGTVTYDGNTFDLTPYLIADTNDFALFRRIGPLSFTFRNNVFIVPPSQQFTVLDSATSTDSIVSERNVYQLGITAVVVKRYHDGIAWANRTFSQWQALGFDTTSVNTDPQLDSDLCPLPASPVVGGAAPAISGPDFTGRYFAQRNDIGAFEYLSPFAKWEALFLTSAQLATPGWTGPQADPDGDGLPSGIEYLLNRSPASSESGEANVTPMTDLEQIGEERFLTLTFRRNALAPELVTALAVSTDLVTWTDVTPDAVEQLPADPITGDPIFRFKLELGDESSLFLRLNVGGF